MAFSLVYLSFAGAALTVFLYLVYAPRQTSKVKSWSSTPTPNPETQELVSNSQDPNKDRKWGGNETFDLF